MSLLTIGQTVAQERSVAASFDELGSRLVEIDIVGNTEPLTSSQVSRIERIAGVVAVLALGPIEDTGHGLFGTAPVPARRVAGAFHMIDVVRHPPDGLTLDEEAYVSASAQMALRFESVAGSVSFESRDVPIVGTFEPHTALAELTPFIIIVGGQGTEPWATRMLVVAEHAGQVQSLGAVLPGIIGVDPLALEMRLPASLNRAREMVSGSLIRFHRRLLVQVLGFGLAVSALTAVLAVGLRRVDFGRRRVLGASRPQLITIVMLSVSFAAGIGALLATFVGVIVVTRISQFPGFSFPTAVAFLSVATSTLGSLPAAIVAAFRDPIPALRVP